MLPRFLGTASVSKPVTGDILLPPETELRPVFLPTATCRRAQFRASGGVGVGNREIQTRYPGRGVAGRGESPPLPAVAPPLCSNV